MNPPGRSKFECRRAQREAHPVRTAVHCPTAGTAPPPTRSPPALVTRSPIRPATRPATRLVGGMVGSLAALMALAAGPAAASGDVARGAAIAASRQQGLCVLCHALPGQIAVFQGDIGPPLAGVGTRLSPEVLRQRLLAPERFNPETVMPSYGRPGSAQDDLQRVPAALRGQPLLNPGQVDDVLAWLASLR